MYFKCCIPNCTSKRENTKLHRFPTDDDQRNKWLDCINCDELKSYDCAKLVKLLVCHKHFETKFHTDKAGIKKTAYPTLFSAMEIEVGVPTKLYMDKENKYTDHTYSRKRHYDHTYCKPIKTHSASLKDQEPLIDLTNMPSSSTSPFGVSQLRNLELASGEQLASSIPKRVCKEIQHEEAYMEGVEPTSTCEPSCEASTSKPSCEASTTINKLTSETSPGQSTPKKMHKKRLIKNFGILTPRCKNIYAAYKRTRRLLNYNVRQRKAIGSSQKTNLEHVTKKMNPLAKKIFDIQIRMCENKKKGRRFSLEEKLIALSLLKQSPKAYRFLQKIFILPSNTTLKKMVAGLNIKTGITTQIFDVIKEEVSGWNEKKRMCTIMFDEMALEPSLTYSHKNDAIHGFVELSDKLNNIADHALVFLVRGAVFRWQQPIAFYFTEGAVSSQQLQIIIKDVVSAVIKTGLLPVALVCDQGSSFQSTMRNLQESTRRDQLRAGIETDDTIHISGTSLSVIYDPPHLLKGMRNNFLSKDIKFEGKLAKWQDIVDVYETDCKHAGTRLLHKLNDEHIIPGKIKKMKVKNCVRVFSKTVAAALAYTANFTHYTNGRPVSNTLLNTAETISFLDDLFDSVNGSSLDPKKTKAKLLRRAVTENSYHHNFWKEAKEKLEKFNFIYKGNEKSVPTLRNWLTTIKSYERIWQILRTKNIKVMRPRYLNSDPIENFFGRVRAYNFRNNSPTCHTFLSTFKSLLITGFIKFHCESFSCEDDACDQLIKVKALFKKQCTDDICDTSQINQDIRVVQENIHDLSNIQLQAIRERLSIHSRAYTAGWVVKKTLDKIKCQECKKCLSTDLNVSVHKWITHREYKILTGKKLTYPSENAVRYFGYVITETNTYLESNGHKKNITAEIKKHLIGKYPFNITDCKEHKDITLNCFLRICIKLCIFNWCNTINKILKGTDLIRLQRHSIPIMQQKALNKYMKRIKNKTYNK